MLHTNRQPEAGAEGDIIGEAKPAVEGGQRVLERLEGGNGGGHPAGVTNLGVGQRGGEAARQTQAGGWDWGGPRWVRRWWRV